MPREIPYVFCTYSVDRNGDGLSAREQLQLLEAIRGRPIVYRKSDADAADADTLAMRPKKFTTYGHEIISWAVGYYVKQRTEATYDSSVDEIATRHFRANGIRYTNFVAIPALHRVAVCDRSSDTFLPAKAGIARLKAILRHAARDYSLDIVMSASPQDVTRALKQWRLKEFSYTVRPFNPHPRDPGRELSEMFKRDGIGRLSGKAIPSAGKVMSMNSGGYIEQTVGLAESGYGQIGFSGTTKDGLNASVKKPKFTLDRDQNEKTQTEPRMLRVMIEPSSDDVEKESRDVARAMLDFYGERN